MDSDANTASTRILFFSFFAYPLIVLTKFFIFVLDFYCAHVAWQIVCRIPCANAAMSLSAHSLAPFEDEEPVPVTREALGAAAGLVSAMPCF
jgi:hypothetical protein